MLQRQTAGRRCACSGAGIMNRSSVLWSAARNWGPRFGTILTFFILARILDKSEIGLFAAAYALVSLTEIFADNGFGDTVVKVRDISPGLATSLLLLNIAFAGILYAGLTGFSDQIGALFGQADFGPVLQLVGLTLVINSFGYVPQALLRKQFEFKRLAFRSFAATLLGAVTGVAMAFAGFGVYSMIMQLLVTSLINALFLWYPVVLRPAKPQFSGMKPLLGFASKVFGTRALGYAALRLIELIIPVLFGPATLAQYIMGSRVPSVLAQMLTAVMVDVNLPYLSKFGDDHAGMREAFYGALRSLCILSVPAFVGVGALAPEISQIAFGANGVGTAYVMLLIALLGAIQSIGYTNDVLVNASGNPQVSLTIQCATVAAIGLLFLAVREMSFEWLMSIYALCHCVMIIGGVIYSSRATGVSLRRFFTTCGTFVAAAIAALAATTITRDLAGEFLPNLLLRTAVLSLVFGATYLLTLAILDFKALKATIGIVTSVAKGARRKKEPVDGPASPTP